MKKIILGAILLAACGGKHTGTTTVVKNTAPPDAAAAETYGGDEYGDEYGDDEYGEEGYGGDEYGEGAYTPPAPTAPDISGKWASACIPGATKGEFRTITFDNTADKWDLHMATFADAACAKRKSDLHVAGPYTMGAQSTAVPAAWEGTFSFATTELTADDAKTAKALGKLCKIKKLKAGTATSIHDAGCVGLGVHPAASCAADNDIVAIDGDKLRFGVRPADNDLCTAEKRPTALDTSVDLTYAWGTSGIAECDQLLSRYQALMNCSKIPAASRDGMFQGLRQMTGQFQALGSSSPDQKSAAQQSCKQGIDAINQSIASVGC